MMLQNAVRNSQTKALERIERLLAGITYKPNWKLSVAPLPVYGSSGGLVDRGMLVISLQCKAPDVNAPGNIIDLSSGRTLQCDEIEKWPDDVLVSLIRDVVITAELHEIDEWLRYDGKNIVDPHPQLAAPKIAPMKRPGELY